MAVAHGFPMVGRWRTARSRAGRLHRIATGCHVLCACFLLGVPRPLTSASLSTAFFQKVAYCYKYCSMNRSPGDQPLDQRAAPNDSRWQSVQGSGVVAPLVCKSFYMGMMSVTCALSQSALENGHAAMPLPDMKDFGGLPLYW